MTRSLQCCSRCLYDASTPAISFDADGVCNYCRLSDSMDREYPTGPDGDRILAAMVEQIKRAGRNKPYDVVVGVSGGCDSSYMVWKACQLGLRPLAVHFDNTWNSATATENIRKVLEKLKVDLFTIVVDNDEMLDLQRAFLESGVPDIECPTDIGLATTLYLAAEKYGIHYQFEGHCFRTEGVWPLGWIYMDGKYNESIVKTHGHWQRHHLKTFPNLTMTRFLRFMLWSRVRKIRPLYWMDYHKEAAKQELTKEFDWTWYGGHHLENRFTNFYHTWYIWQRYGRDTRINGHAALVRSGQMSREQALDELAQPPRCDPAILELVKKRFAMTDDDLQQIIDRPQRTFRDYRTYKPLFERMRPFFYLMYKLDLVPRSFYEKYTSRTGM